MQKQGLNDITIAKITGVPYSSLIKWKRTSADNYRRKLYELLKSMDESKLAKAFARQQS